MRETIFQDHDRVLRRGRRFVNVYRREKFGVPGAGVISYGTAHASRYLAENALSVTRPIYRIVVKPKAAQHGA